MTVVYEDNHIIIVSKAPGEIVQGDKTGDMPLVDIVKGYLKERYKKPGQVFLGVVHRLDRPVAGLVVFAKTSKALSRMSELFREGKVNKTYWALTKNAPPADKGVLTSWLVRDEQKNKSFSYGHEVPGAKMAKLEYRELCTTDSYHLLEVDLLTGRHHQIRCQLASVGCPIRGDLKYGAKRSNKDGSISLLSHRLQFVHPVSGKMIDVVSPMPEGDIWKNVARNLNEAYSKGIEQ